MNLESLKEKNVNLVEMYMYKYTRICIYIYHTPGSSKQCLKCFRYNSCQLTIPLGVDPWQPLEGVPATLVYRDYNNPHHQCVV